MKKVSFYSAGHKLPAYLFVPELYDKGQRLPGIVCCHGISGMIELYMTDIAQRFYEAGHVSLTFYHRGLGESEGPRCRIIPTEQAEDVMNAITYLQTLDEVDSSRIGLYGTSFGGANAVYAGAMDRRAKCIVSTCGIGDGERWLRSLRRRWEWQDFLKRIEEDRARRTLTGESEYVDPFEIMVPDPDTRKVMEEKWRAHSQTWGCKGYPLETAEAIINYKPEMLVDRISPRPILFIACERDVLVPPEESISMHQKAREPKALSVIPGTAHYDVYKFVNPKTFEKVMNLAVEWYQKYL